jgi:uncharacterized Tic20 family protein
MNATSSVGKACPKCRYKRTATETAPDWQCPKCGIAYAKFEQAQSGTMPGTSAAAPAGRPASVGRAAAPSGGASTGLGMFVHLSILIGFIVPFFGLIVPIVVWITKSGQNDLAVANAKEAINFQITMILWTLLVVGLVLLGFQIFVFFFVAGAVGIALAIAFVVLPIVAAIKANGGDEYRYPLTVHIFG